MLRADCEARRGNRGKFGGRGIGVGIKRAAWRGNRGKFGGRRIGGVAQNVRRGAGISAGGVGGTKRRGGKSAADMRNLGGHMSRMARPRRGRASFSPRWSEGRSPERNLGCAIYPHGRAPEGAASLFFELSCAAVNAASPKCLCFNVCAFPSRMFSFLKIRPTAPMWLRCRNKFANGI